ncbi:MAG: tRNA pseudouridine(38-40) synthase TruA [Dehalococcoidia bacterium]|nr:tRNA pseudouridine(38-40) synthase TruA [Dehalococcoidia bacterium]
MGGIVKIALLIEYEGTNYYGFQIQTSVPSIQGELEKAISKVTGEVVRLHGAGRTDAGVHASGQVATFETQSGHHPCTFVKALNFHLPADIAIRDACQVEADFDPRRHALSREYRYTILNSPVRLPLTRRWAYLVPRKLNIGAMSEACDMLLGQHDYASFTNKEGGAKNTIRTILGASLKRRGNSVVFDISANAFLPQQVRRTVGCLIRIGLGDMEAAELGEMVVSPKIGTARPTAPSHGLCLIRVNYSYIGFGSQL